MVFIRKVQGSVSSGERVRPARCTAQGGILLLPPAHDRPDGWLRQRRRQALPGITAIHLAQDLWWKIPGNSCCFGVIFGRTGNAVNYVLPRMAVFCIMLVSKFHCRTAMWQRCPQQKNHTATFGGRQNAVLAFLLRLHNQLDAPM